MSSRLTRITLALAAVAAAYPAATAMAQASGRPAPAGFVEILGGTVAPTFDIADVATAGPAFALAGGLRLGPRLALLGEFDYGKHQDKPTKSVDIATRHYIGKIGWSLTGARERGWETMLTLGAGAVTFDVDGGDAKTYPAISAGAKISYAFSPRAAFVLSPQGDIAFTKKSELSTDNAWVWPLTAGFRFSF